jgi:hypothetical protein
MIHGGVSAPTGKTALTDPEFVLSQILSENIFQFRLPNYGQGFSTKVGTAFAFPVQKGIIAGAGLNYILKSAYHPLNEASDYGNIEYRPGNETAVFMGFDVQLGETGKWNMDVVYTLYGTDKLKVEQDWKDIFNSGDKILVNSNVLLGIGQTLLWTNIHWRQKGKNEYWKGSDLESVSKKSDGNQFEMDVMWQPTKWKQGAFRLLGDGRFYSENEDGERGAKILGGGAGLIQRFSTRGSLQIVVKYLQGTLRSVKDITVNGIDFNCSFVFEI